jgi:hypothetical protein
MSKLSFLNNGAKYPREVRRIDLGDYHQALSGDFIEVWVNWSKAMNDRALALAVEASAVVSLSLGEERDKRLAALNEKAYAHQAEWFELPVDQVKALQEVDVSLYSWIIDQANAARRAYEADRKKAVGASGDT